VRKAQQIRAAARELRDRVSRYGRYDDDDLAQFWHLVSTAGRDLGVANSHLGETGGLTPQFFASMARERRRPKLYNFLRALTAIVDTANERLTEVDSGTAATFSKAERSQQDFNQIRQLATSLAKMAHAEIDQLDRERPNDPSSITKLKKQRDLLKIFAVGFARIASELAELDQTPIGKGVLNKATKAAAAVGKRVETWWEENGNEAVDWGVRLNFFTAGVAALGWAGASMPIATAAVAAIVGGGKVVDAIRDRDKKD
jgi:hypothetical protein